MDCAFFKSPNYRKVAAGAGAVSRPARSSARTGSTGAHFKDF
jgi:hypothetical protein